jgi:hypothetical protein
MGDFFSFRFRKFQRKARLLRRMMVGSASDAAPADHFDCWLPILQRRADEEVSRRWKCSCLGHKYCLEGDKYSRASPIEPLPRQYSSRKRKLGGSRSPLTSGRYLLSCTSLLGNKVLPLSRLTQSRGIRVSITKHIFGKPFYPKAVQRVMADPSPEPSQTDVPDLPPGGDPQSEPPTYYSEVPGHDPRVLLEIDKLLLQGVMPTRKPSSN